MVKRFLNLLNWEFSNINQAALLLGFFALMSQVLGLFRDRALASVLGASSIGHKKTYIRTLRAFNDYLPYQYTFRYM